MENGLLPIQISISKRPEADNETARFEQEPDCRKPYRADWILTKSALLSRTTVQWSVSKINLNFMSLRDPAAAVQDNVVRNVKLFGKNQWFVQVHEDGKVTGTREQCDPGVNLQLESLRKGLVRIFSVDVKRYLAMDSNGRLFATKTKVDSTIFKHVKGLNGFHTFSSHKYYKETPNDMFMALKKDGMPRKGNKTCGLHKGSQFLLV